MKRIIGVFFFLLMIAGSYEQEQDSIPENRAKVVLRANLYGTASLFSLNLEGLFFIKPKFSLMANLGMGFNMAFNFSDDRGPG